MSSMSRSIMPSSTVCAIGTKSPSSTKAELQAVRLQRFLTIATGRTHRTNNTPLSSHHLHVARSMRPERIISSGSAQVKTNVPLTSPQCRQHCSFRALPLTNFLMFPYDTQHIHDPRILILQHIFQHIFPAHDRISALHEHCQAASEYGENEVL